jgi:hypothetical protein
MISNSTHDHIYMALLHMSVNELNKSLVVDSPSACMHCFSCRVAGTAIAEVTIRRLSNIGIEMYFIVAIEMDDLNLSYSELIEKIFWDPEVIVLLLNDLS